VVGLGHGIEAEGFFVLVVVSNEKQKDSVHDMLSRLQQLDWLRLRLLFVSPSGYRGQAEKLRQKGFHGYLAKPFHLGLFWEMACELIQRPEEDFAHTILTRHSLSDSGPKTVEGSEQGQESGEVWPCPGKVLLVEDNSVNQIVAKRMLEKMGCDVEVAGNGQEALDALKRDPEVYSLVFMDIQMPIMDGYEATRRLRALQSRSSRLPIVAMTAGALQEDKESSLEVGMDDYLAKPIKWDDLKEILYKWTAKASE
jgi:CheY-like chemotaxis protein